jgi:colanic acid biosynthesis glycosyl transferase WcaI
MLQDRSYVGQPLKRANGHSPSAALAILGVPSADPARLLNVLFYGLNYAPELTGIGKYSSELCEWLAARGHAIHVVTGHPYYPTWTLSEGYDKHRYQREVRAGVHVHHCPLYLPSSPAAKGRILSHASFALSSAPKLMAMAGGLRPDVLVAVTPSFMVAPAALAAARMFRIPSWLHIQDFEIDAAFELGMLAGGRLRRAATLAESSILRRFDRVSTISPRMMDRVRGKGVERDRTIEFRNWVDTDEIRPADRRTALRRQLGIPDDKIVALYAGSIAAKQGIERLVEAAAALETTAPEIVFVFCGAGALLDRLVGLSANLANVRFIDLQPNGRMREVLATADIHLIPQRPQVADLMLPSKLAPILASGRPAVAMAEPGTQLASEVAGAGIVISPADEKALQEAIITLARNADMRARMGERGRHLACTRWRKQLILKEFESRLIALAETRIGNA